MLVTLNEVLTPAREGHYAVGLFNVVTMEHAEGVFQAAESLQAPMIVGTAEAFLRNVRLEAVAGMLLERAKQSPLPIVVHFDHGRTFENCLRALKLGFSSVMYDCSAMPYEENVARMTEMVRIAHAMGATVEGELGCVAGSEDGSEASPRALLTNPDVAADFTQRTGVDALAISVGNAHGAYKLPPKLDFELIEQIRALVDVPLVLHGGSGLTDQDFARAIACGISKVNIFTDINQAQAVGSLQALDAGELTAMNMIPYQVAAVRVAAQEKMTLFGSVGKG